MFRFLRRRIRGFWSIAVITALWANRRDVLRWSRFIARAFRERKSRPLGEILTEARVRLAVSSDSKFRRDPALNDLTVENGIVTLLINPASWPDFQDRSCDIKRIKGIVDVASRLATTNLEEGTYAWN